MDTSERYRVFAELEAAGSSPIYERTARAVADDVAIVQLLDRLPPAKRQPNLLFAACRYLGMTFGEPAETLGLIRDRWRDIATVMLERSTQTNEPARAATFLPLLAQLDQPVALIEVGASAGLCLYPDHYRIQYDDAPPIGPRDSPLSIHVDAYGPVPIPTSSPEVAWRTGIDLNPLDVRDPDDLAWLAACIWPEHTTRHERLLAAAAVVSSEPPDLVRGDLLDNLDDVLASVPDGATPVVFHSAVLAYVHPRDRERFAERVRNNRAVVWISNEAPGVVRSLATNLTPPEQAPSKAFFLVGIGGERAVAISDPHGSWVRWAAGTVRAP